MFNLTKNKNKKNIKKRKKYFCQNTRKKEEAVYRRFFLAEA